MPTQAFMNLSIDKQNKLLEAAENEFSEKVFEDASINKIIKSIDMPRGTFYLYFANKEDIYNYIFDFYKEKIVDKFSDFLVSNNGNIFEGYISLFNFVTGNENPKLKKLINNFFINMNSRRMDDSIPRKHEHGGLFKKSKIIEKINMDTLNLSGEEIYTLISILMPLFFQNVAHTFIHPNNKKQIKEHYIKQLNIIRKGIERENYDKNF